MSLINDALKRASESDRNRPAQASLPRPMQPVAQPASIGVSWLVAASIVAALCVALAAWFLWKGWNAGHSAAATPAIQLPPPAPKLAPVVHETPPPPAPSPVVIAPAAPAPAPPVSVPDVWPIKLTVKAIFYSKTNPRALVNGITVETGDKIDDVLVTGILSDRIFVDWKGQSKIIMMGEQ
jgi:hypothetical protein